MVYTQMCTIQNLKKHRGLSPAVIFLPTVALTGSAAVSSEPGCKETIAPGAEKNSYASTGVERVGSIDFIGYSRLGW